MSPESQAKAGLSDLLAAEGTFLAWIRTGLALMGFGFVVARFGLFLKQMQFLQQTPPNPVLRALAVVRHRIDRARRDHESSLRMASSSIGAGVE
jgi:hypothetical protein